MKPKVYIETSVVGHLAARPSRDPVTAAHQLVTIAWWETRREFCELFYSEVVLREAARGNVTESRKRIEVLEGLKSLPVTPDAERIAARLLGIGPLPAKAAEDALHIGVATAHRMDYLLTWNCAHLANVILRPRIDAICQAAGYNPVSICTPEQLMTVQHGLS